MTPEPLNDLLVGLRFGGFTQDVGVDEDLEALGGADGAERDDVVAVLDGQTREAGALFPDQVVGLALAPHDLAAAAGEHQDAVADAPSSPASPTAPVEDGEMWRHAMDGLGVGLWEIPFDGVQLLGGYSAVWSETLSRASRLDDFTARLLDDLWGAIEQELRSPSPRRTPAAPPPALPPRPERPPVVPPAPAPAPGGFDPNATMFAPAPRQSVEHRSGSASWWRLGVGRSLRGQAKRGAASSRASQGWAIW